MARAIGATGIFSGGSLFRRARLGPRGVVWPSTFGSGRSLTVAVRFVMWASLVAGCAAPPSATQVRRPEPTPARQPTPATAPAPTTQTGPPPAALPTPASPPRDDAPAGEPSPPAPPTPEHSTPPYLTVLDRFDPAQAVTADARTAPGNRLAVETRNVRRLHIDRDAVPLQSRRRIVLQLDGQPFEWLAGSEVTEFERSVNGEWTPVRSGQRGGEAPARP